MFTGDELSVVKALAVVGGHEVANTFMVTEVYLSDNGQ